MSKTTDADATEHVARRLRGAYASKSGVWQMSNQFRHFDTKRPDGFYVAFERLQEHDPHTSPEEYLFQDEEYREQDQDRLDAWRRDEWSYVFLFVRARCEIISHGLGTRLHFDSAGIGGIESDSDPEYFAECFYL